MRIFTWGILLASLIAADRCRGGDVSPWTPVRLPSEATGVTLRGVCFVNAQKGWVVGDKGLCLTTTDGGQTWRTLATGSDATLRCVRFNDENKGYACGDGDPKAPKSTGHIVTGRAYLAGSFLATNDGGRTWKQNWVPCNFEVWCLESSAAPVLQVGVGLDGHLDGDITRSSDDGATWKESRVYRALSDIRAVDAKRWIAAGSPVSVDFTGGAIKDPCYVARECRILISDDGGKSWRPSKGSNGKACLRGLAVRPKLPAFAVGDGGALLTSDDSGATWRELQSPTTDGLRAVAYDAVGKTVVAAGNRGIFILSQDGGKTWTASWVGRPVRLLAVEASANGFWAAGEQGALLRANAPDLLAAKELPPPPAVVEAKPQAATAFQRARVRVGDFAVYAQTIAAPAMGMNCKFETRQTVTAATATDFTLAVEVVKGNPPPGTPKKNQATGGYSIIVDYGSLKVTEAKTAATGQADTPDKTGAQAKPEASAKTPSGGPQIVTERRADEKLEVKGQKLNCWRIDEALEVPGGVNTVSAREWFCSTNDVPIDGLVKKETTQTMTMPNGAKVVIRMTQDLVDWGRGKE